MSDNSIEQSVASLFHLGTFGIWPIHSDGLYMTQHDSAVLEELLHQRVVPLDFDHYDRITQNLCLDAGYVGKAYAASNEGMTPHIRPRGEEKKAIELHGFKPKRWIVEVAHSWFNRFRKIHTRYEKTYMAYCGLLHLAAAMITMNKGMKIYPAM